MDVEQAWLTDRAERLDPQAAGLLTRRPHDIAKGLLHRALVSRARMKTREDEQFQASSSSTHLNGLGGSLTESAPRSLLAAACAGQAVEIGYASGTAKATRARGNL